MLLIPMRRFAAASRTYLVEPFVQNSQQGVNAQRMGEDLAIVNEPNINRFGHNVLLRIRFALVRASSANR